MKKYNYKKIGLGLMVVFVAVVFVGCGKGKNKEQEESIGANNFEQIEKLIWYKVPELGIQFKVKPNSVEDLKYVVSGFKEDKLGGLSVYFYYQSQKDFLESRNQIKIDDPTTISELVISKIKTDKQSEYLKMYGREFCLGEKILLKTDKETFCQPRPQASPFSSEQEANEFKEIFKSKGLGLYLDTIKIIEISEGDERVQIDTSNWKTYKNEDYGFELKYPKEYSLGLSGSRNITFVHEKCLPLVQSENKNINKVSECAIEENFIIKILDNDLDTFIENLKRCESGKCSAEIILQEEYKEDVLNGKRIIVRNKNSSSLEYIVIQGNEKLYVFVFSELNSNKLLEIISTLKFPK